MLGHSNFQKGDAHIIPVMGTVFNKRNDGCGMFPEPREGKGKMFFHPPFSKQGLFRILL